MKTADDLFKEFKILSVSEFFKKNADMLGYTGKIRSMTVLVHEMITNALDFAGNKSRDRSKRGVSL